MTTIGICPACWHEHDGPCDTRPIEDRRLDERRKQADEAARQITRERKGGKK